MNDDRPSWESARTSKPWNTSNKQLINKKPHLCVEIVQIDVVMPAIAFYPAAVYQIFLLRV